MPRNLSRNHLNGLLPAEFGNLRSIQTMWANLDKSTAVWNGVTSVFLIFLLLCFLVTCHSTNCLVAFLQNWVNCKMSFLCKFMVFFPCGWSSTFCCVFIYQADIKCEMKIYVRILNNNNLQGGIPDQLSNCFSLSNL